MKTIYIGFAKPTPGGFVPFAWLIQAVEKRSYDHVYIRLSDPVFNTPLIFQASGLMVNLMAPRVFLSGNIAVKEYEINCTDEQYANLWVFILTNLGIPYSLLEDFGILLMKIFKLKKNPFNKDGSAAFCSQLGAQVCQLFGIAMPADSSTIDPSGLDTILSGVGLPLVQNPVFS